MEKEVKTFSLILVPVCFLLMAFHPAFKEVGLYVGAPFIHRFTYMWYHANIIHFCINLYALLSVVFLFNINAFTMLSAFLVAAFLPDCMLGYNPLVGLSGLIFFLFGSIVRNIRDRWYYISVNLIVIFFGALLSNVAFWVHLWCFLLGLIYAGMPDIRKIFRCSK